MNILGYFEDDSRQPMAFMNMKGVIVFSNESMLKKYNKLGGTKELHNILSNITYYGLPQVKPYVPKLASQKSTKSDFCLTQYTKYSKINNQNKQSGGGGFFGESNGKCGWGDFPNCCFYDCAPLWRTNVWPFHITM